MNLQLDFWQLVSMGFGLVGAWLGFAKLFFAQVDRRLDERFKGADAHIDSLRSLLSAHAETDSARLGRIEKENNAQGERISRLEADSARVPTHDDLSKIHHRIDEMISVMGRLPGIERLLHSMNDYLREHGK
jgi:hypothetical protein